MNQKNFLKIAMTLLITLVSISSYTQSAGDIAFIAFNGDGDDEFAFVALVDIPSNTTIWFTDNEWDGDSFNNINEGEVQWTYSSILPAGSVVVIQGNSGTLVSGLGTVSGGGANLGVSNETLYALLSEPSATIMPTPGFLAGISNDETGSGGTLTGTGLTSGTNFIDFADDADGYKYTGARTGEASFSDYLPLIMNTANWQIESSDGTLILPISSTSFTTGATPPGVTLGVVSNNTAETGTTATFTVVLNAQPATSVVLNVSSGDTGEVTLDLATLTFTNGNWDTPQTVTASGVDDAIQDGKIDVTITVSVDDALSDDDYDGISTSTTITNEDDELSALVINEILADPDLTTGDANGDGNVDTSEDEFVELYNSLSTPLDISGYKLSDGASQRHIFPNGTVIPPNGTIVVFGAGNPTGIAGLVQVSSSGLLGLNNGGDTITIVDDSDVLVVTETYGAAGNNQSIAREPDFSGTFVDHSSIASNTLNFSPGKDNTDNSPFVKTWTGATSSDWDTASNWIENSTPSTSDNVIIHSGLATYPTVSSATTVNSVIINAGASLISNNTFTGDVTYNTTLGSENWYLVSSPVAGETYNNAYVAANNLAINGTNNAIATYTTGSDGWSYMATGGGSTFSAGTGYSVRRETGAGSGTISFTGSLNTSDVPVGVVIGGNGGFNLIGNPYTSYLNSASFLTDNSGSLVSETIWVWNQATSNYETKVAGTGFVLAPTQGFFVSANTATNLNIAESYQTATGDTFQKTVKTEVTLNMTDGTNNRFAKMYYLSNVTKGFDNGFDGETFGGIKNKLDIFTHLIADSQGKNYQLQSLPNSDYENMVVPIGIIAEADKEITFTAESLNLPSDLKVFLEDRLTNTFTRLDEVNGKYTITLTEKSDGVGRFYLHTKSSSVLSSSETLLESVRIYKTDATTLRIAGLSQGKTNVKLFTMLGKQVVNTSFTSNGTKEISLPNLAAGIYIVSLETETGKLNKKITLE